MNIEFKKITLLSEDIYNVSKYPNTGFFVVCEELVGQDVLVYNDGNIVWFMLNLSDIIYFDSSKETREPKLEIEPNPKSNGLVSEELFLKAMSLMINKDESYKK